MKISVQLSKERCQRQRMPKVVGAAVVVVAMVCYFGRLPVTAAFLVAPCHLTPCSSPQRSCSSSKHQ